MSEIKLSKRMQTVADMATGAKRVVDIGCDHAFVSIYLKQSGLTQNVIAMDVKEGPLDIARKNINDYGLSDYIEVRSSDGFDALMPGEADVAIIAGMGGLLMIDILTRGRVHTENGIELVLQPQSDIDKVRAYLRSIGYKIVDECMLLEDGKYYMVIKSGVASESENKELLGMSEDSIRIRDMYGPILLKNKDKVLKGYVEEQLIKNKALSGRLSLNDTPSSKQRIAELTEEEKMLERVVNYMRE